MSLIRLAFVSALVACCLSLACTQANAIPSWNGTVTSYKNNVVTSGSQVYGLLLSNDELTLYVSDGFQGTVWAVDTKSGSGKSLVANGTFHTPAGITWGPVQSTLYVADTFLNHVYSVNLVIGGVKQVDAGSAFSQLGGIAFDGISTIYAADRQLNTVSTIDINSGAVATFASVATPYGLAISPFATLPKFLITSSYLADQVSYIDINSKTITPLALNTPEPATVAISANGQTLFITDYQAQSIIAVTNFIPSSPPLNITIANVIAPGTLVCPQGLAMNSNNKFAYVGDNTSNLNNRGLYKITFPTSGSSEAEFEPIRLE